MAQFFAGDNTYNFDTVAGQQPWFVQNFPAMTFNPRPGIVTGNPDTNYDNPPIRGFYQVQVSRQQ